jgi:cephalosporin-C deacetylase-like acetyl esterase
MRLLPERCTGLVNVYEVNLGNINNSRFYGIVCIPKKEGKYPAVFIPPGAGVRPYYGEIALAERGIITFQVGIHGIPVTMDETVYANLREGALKGYQLFNLDDKNNYYYKRVYLGCVRSIDFLVSLPQYDGENLGVTGGSQGGALTIVTAALDSRVKVLAAHYPALADLTGFLYNRAGGWPLIFYYKYGNNINVKDKTETIGYYDVVNFAKSLTVEGLYTWGFNDEIVPPTSMYAAYNSITAPKNLILNLEAGHFDFPETNSKMADWLVGKLKRK